MRVATGCSVSTSSRGYDANDRMYWADLDIAPLWLGTDLRGFVATVRDITHEVVAQRSAP